MNRIDRLTAILLLLQSRRVTTAEHLADHFEISVRTVYRDIAALGEAGVPILAEAGVGYSLMRGYHVPPVMFTQQEAAALFTCSELAGQFGDTSLVESLRSAVLKVRAVLPRERNDFLARLGTSIGVTARQQSPSQPGESHLLPVQEAVVTRRQLKLGYDAGSRGELTHRTVDPLGVVYYGRHWHLVAWCHLRDDFRDFRLDRIRQLDALPAHFDGHHDFSLVEFIERDAPETDLTPVRIEFQRWALERVLAEIPCRVEHQEPLPDNRVRVDALAYSLDWLAGWLLGLGTATTAVSPPALAEKTAAAARRVAGHHEKRTPVAPPS